MTVFILSACAINQNVTPVQRSAIEDLCIERNDKVLMADFEPTLGRLIEERGIKVRPFSGARPDDCRHLARYIANWRWDLAMYLYYVRIEVFEDSRSIGLAEYDATLGGLNLGKFGSTEGKLRPLVDQLFARP
jgi:hypothetical protein